MKRGEAGTRPGSRSLSDINAVRRIRDAIHHTDAREYQRAARSVSADRAGRPGIPLPDERPCRAGNEDLRYDVLARVLTAVFMASPVAPAISNDDRLYYLLPADRPDLLRPPTAIARTPGSRPVRLVAPGAK